MTLCFEMAWRRKNFRYKGEKTFFVHAYSISQGNPFFTKVEQLLPHSKEILLVGAGLNLIWEKNILDTILERVATKQAKVRICMANPFSPHMESRYIEEEMRNENPLVGREGMRKNVRALVHKIAEAGNPDGLSFLLFECYPTLATLIFDDNIFVYPYGYHQLGNVSPILHFLNDGSETAQFWIKNAERIFKYAVSAKDVVHSRERREYFSENWIAAAVYIVPRSETALYRFGSAVIGYDIWNERPLTAPQGELANVRPYVGEAEIYGFHATVADSLFFTAQSGVDRVEAELKFLCQDFMAFTLDELRLVENFRDSGDVVLTCEDESGVLEALHCELVNRVYKLAISSNFLTQRTGKQLPSKGATRARLMVEHYGSPYILNAYKPHFTLCSNSPRGDLERQRVLALLKESAERNGVLEPLEVSEICLVTKRNGEKRWKMAKRFSLG